MIAIFLSLGALAVAVGSAFSADRIQLIDAECAGPWELPVIGTVTAPTAVLIRPDGYVAR